MERKKAFEPGEMVATFTGQAGMVISEELYPKVRENLKEKRRPGYYFAPGCCQHPDYVIQIPIIFEDGTYDVMRAMNIKKTPNIAEEKIAEIRNFLDRIMD